MNARLGDLPAFVAPSLLEVWGLGFRVWGLGFGIEESMFRGVGVRSLLASGLRAGFGCFSGVLGYTLGLKPQARL